MRILPFFFSAVSLLAQSAWQKPGEIQQPKGSWQKPGAIQIPKGIQAVHEQDSACERRLIVGADALFEFNKSDLAPDAIQTLEAFGPLVAKAGPHPITVEGHTDSIGSLEYNQELSARRGNAVRAWLLARNYAAPASLTVRTFGKTRPIAPNTNPDGSDNPAGRQKNRRVEIVIDTCR
jgi:outer membrane protein OmpA-like peptidoglycan-associated protein